MSQVNIDYENLHRFADQQGINRNKLLTAVKMCVSVDSAALQAAPAQEFDEAALIAKGWTLQDCKVCGESASAYVSKPAQPVNQVLVDALPSREAFERHWVLTRGPKKAGKELKRHPLQPQCYIQDSANRHWVTWQAAQAQQT